MAKQKFAVTGDQYRTIHRKVRDIFRQLDQKSGSPLEPELVIEALQDIVNGNFSEFVQKRNRTIRRSGNEILFTLDPVDGSQTLAGAADVFKSGIQPLIRDWKMDECDRATEKTTVMMFDMVKDATVARLFEDFDKNFDRLCLTQHQIVNFCQNYPEVFGGYYDVLFLFKHHDEYFVAFVDVIGRGLSIRAVEYKSPYALKVSHQYGIVVPI